MKKITVISIALLFFVIFNYSSVSADDGRKAILQAKDACAERLKSPPSQTGGNGYEKVVMEDGTLVICGKGGKATWSETAGAPLNTALSSEAVWPNCGIQNMAEIMKSAGITNGYALKTLIETFDRTLNPIMKKDGPYDYRAADALFSQIEAGLESVGWTGQDTGWYMIGEGDTALWRLAWIAKSHWQRYGIKVLNSLAKLSRSATQMDHADRHFIVSALQDAIRGPLFNANKNGQEPTDADLRMLAGHLLEFAQVYPENTYFDYLTGYERNERKVLWRIAPDVLRKLELIEAKQKNIHNLKNATEEAVREWQKSRPETSETTED